MLNAQQAAASEFDKTQGAKGLSKAEAAELEASWQQQVGFLFLMGLSVSNRYDSSSRPALTKLTITNHINQARDLETWAAASTVPGAYDFAQENEFLQDGAGPSDLFAEGCVAFTTSVSHPAH